LLVFALLVLVLFPLKRRWLDAAGSGKDEVVLYIVDHLIELTAIVIYSLVAARVERRPFESFGLPWRQALRRPMWLGAGAGLMSLTALVLALRVADVIRVEASSSSLLRSAGFAVAYALIFLLLAVREEFLFRGYGLFTLTEATGFWPAATVSSLWYVWGHWGNKGETTIGLVNIALFGMLSCLILRRTGSLWVAVGFHASWNWGETYLFGTADSGAAAAPGHLLATSLSHSAPAWLSGGPVGPEGSVLCSALLVLVGVACARAFRSVRYPSAASQSSAA
jgi:membrane protease YdiL (CAAX protease family)